MLECRLVELLQNRGDHSTEANQTTTTLNALIKDGGQSKKASVSFQQPASRFNGQMTSSCTYQI